MFLYSPYSMSVVAMDFMVVVLILTVFLTKSNTESTEDEQPYSHPYAPSTVDFQDIYTNSFNKLTVLDEKSSPSDEDFHLTNIPTQFVEFHPRVLKISRITPPPRVLLNASYIKKTVTEEPTTTNGYTDEPEEPMKVIPIRDQQRGVLDILFPAARVRSFKDVFDSFKRMLSYTFRK